MTKHDMFGCAVFLSLVILVSLPASILVLHNASRDSGPEQLWVVNMTSPHGKEITKCVYGRRPSLDVNRLSGITWVNTGGRSIIVPAGWFVDISDGENNEHE